MKWLFAFGWIPVPVFYVSKLFAGGFSPLVCIFIQSKYRTDEGLHIHELNHIEQAYKMFLLPFGFMYLVSKDFRLKVEIDSYKKQIAFYGPGQSIEFAVRILATDYGLGKTEKEIRELLTAK